MSIFFIFENVFGSFNILLPVVLLSAILKFYLIVRFINFTVDSRYKTTYLIFLFSLISSLFESISWGLFAGERIFFPASESIYINFFVRLNWACAVLYYQALSLFIYSLVEQKNYFNLTQKLFFVFNALYSAFFLIAAFLYFDQYHVGLVYIAQKTYPLTILPIMIISLLMIFSKLKKNKLPKLLRKQIHIIIYTFFIPYLLLEFLHMGPALFSWTSFLNSLSLTMHTVANSYAFVTISTVYFTIALLYCTKKIIGLRFLNIKDHVQPKVPFHFMNEFKETLGQLSMVTNIAELAHIAQRFFKEGLGVPFTKTSLYFRKNGFVKELLHDRPKSNLVESFLQTQDQAVLDYIAEQQVLILDELEFSSFHKKDEVYRSALYFLESINADVFLPLYSKDQIVAYLVIDKDARNDTFYSALERDQIIVFGNYLSNVINLLQTKNIDLLLAREKELQERLYLKHQENTKYRESIRSFLRNNKQEIGIIFYKGGRFIFGNQYAKEMIKVNCNTQLGHPFSQTIKKLVTHVQQYQAQQTTFACDVHNRKIVLCALPDSDQKNVIVTISYPEISDVVKKQIELLKDPNHWDYLLYLETTESGKLVNKLIPGSSETILNFKIDLLRTALSKKASFLSLSEEDNKEIAQLLHKISLREKLHTLTVTTPEKQFCVATSLFGLGEIFTKEPTIPLLQKLDGTGTLFIENIELLSLETQRCLAEFLRYGYFKKFKSEEKVVSSVRVICSSRQDISLLVQEGSFCPMLYQELHECSLALPSLAQLPDAELGHIIDAIAAHAIQVDEFQRILELSDRDKRRLIKEQFVSIHALKKNVYQLLADKSSENAIEHEAILEPESQADPDLAYASRLGKGALRDPKILAKLWAKFKNQNKIATFLGVNRSSVHRRCKEYNIGL